MTAFITIADHPFNAGQRERFEVPAGAELADWLADAAGVDRTALFDEPPFAVVLNGEQIQPDQIDVVLSAGDLVSVLPRQYAIGAVSGWVLAAWAAAAVAIGYLLMPEVPSQSNQLDRGSQSPTYSADAQGNKARLGSPIPVAYGRTRMYPDFAAAPYRTYADHDQYLYQLFSLGQTQADYSEIRVGDTPLENYSNVEHAFYAAGENVELFPTAVVPSDEVTDIQLWAMDEPEHEESPESPAYVAVPVGKSASAIEVDLVFPGGHYWMGSDGEVKNHPVHVQVFTRAIDDTGAATGDWVMALDQQIDGGTLDVQRYTYRVPVSGRVEVKLRRNLYTPGHSGVPSHAHKTDVHWSGLRAYLDEQQTFDHPVLALKMRVDDQLSSQSERKINLLLNAKLPVRGADGQWSEPVTTRNPAWAFCDAIRAEYGGKFTDDMISDEVYQVAAAWESESVYFDGVFDTDGRLWDTLKQICGVGIAEPTLIGGVFGIRRDVKEVPEYHFGMSDIVADSFSIEYTTYDPWGNDSVEIEYTDPDTWKPATVLCSVTGTTDRPQKVKLLGCTDIDRASTVGHHIAARREYRNRRVSFRTELNGRLPYYGDTVRVSHEFPQWSVSGSILRLAEDGRTVALSEPVNASAGGWLLIPGPTGKIQGPFQVTRGPTDFHVVLPADHGAVINTPDRAPSKFHSSFGFAQTSESIGLPIKVRSLRSVSDYVIEISGEYDAPEVYSPDKLPVPAAPGVLPSASLDITGLRVRHQGTLEHPRLLLSWNPVQSAVRYRVEYAYGEAAYNFAAAPAAPNVGIEVRPGSVRLRVAAETETGLGPWSTLVVDAGDRLDAPPPPEGLELKEAFTGRQASFVWQPVVGCDYVVSVTDGASRVYRTETVTDPAFTYTIEMAAADGCGREFTVNVSSRLNGKLSVAPAKLAVRNEPPAVLTGINVIAGADSIGVFFNMSDAPDLAGYVVHYGQSPVTTASPKIVVGGQTGYIQIPITDTKTYRVIIGAYDVWGHDDINFSAETADIAAGIREGALAAAVRAEIAKIPALDNALAGVQDDLNIVETAQGGQATQINTLQAQVNSQSNQIASVQTYQNSQANDIDDLEAMWITRVKAGTSQAYVGLRSGSSDPSRVILGADEVAIGNPGAEVFPFVMSGGSAYIADAVIRQASIGRLKLAGNSVTVTVSSTAQGRQDLTGSLAQVRYVQFYAPEYMPFLITFNCRHGTSSPASGRAFASWQMQLELDGSNIYDSGEASGDTPMVSAGKSVSAGWHTVKIKMRNINGTGHIDFKSLAVLGTMR